MKRFTEIEVTVRKGNKEYVYSKKLDDILLSGSDIERVVIGSSWPLKVSGSILFISYDVITMRIMVDGECFSRGEIHNLIRELEQAGFERQ